MFKLKQKLKIILKKLLGENFYRKIRIYYTIFRFKRGIFYEADVEFLKKIIKPGDICIDIGANVGEHLYVLSKLVGNNGKVIGFEPSSEAFEILQAIIKKTKLRNVEVFKIGLGNKKETKEFITPIDEYGVPNLSLTHIKNKETKSNGLVEKVEITTLDDLMIQNPLLEKTKFMNCDVEGYELMVLEGGMKFISKVKPIILVEIIKEHTERYGYQPNDIFSFLRDLRYQAFILIDGNLKPTESYDEKYIYYLFQFMNYENPSGK